MGHPARRTRATIIKAMRDWLDNNGFTLVDTPILTPSAAEGTTTLFKTDFHGEDRVPGADRAAL